jgi:hypothetical protein
MQSFSGEYPRIDIPLQKFHNSRGLGFIKEINNACVDWDLSFDAVVIQRSLVLLEHHAVHARCHGALVHKDRNKYL